MKQKKGNQYKNASIILYRFYLLTQIQIVLGFRTIQLKINPLISSNDILRNKITITLAKLLHFCHLWFSTWKKCLFHEKEWTVVSMYVQIQNRNRYCTFKNEMLCCENEKWYSINQMKEIFSKSTTRQSRKHNHAKSLKKNCTYM